MALSSISTPLLAFPGSGGLPFGLRATALVFEDLKFRALLERIRLLGPSSANVLVTRVDRVINCTGPESDCRRIKSPLLSDLMRQKLVRPDPLFLGLDASAEGALIDAFGDASDFLYTLGPARKGSLWETTAVPEIRRQVAELAEHLLATFARIESARLQETLQTVPAMAQHSAVQHIRVPRSALAHEAGRSIATSDVA